MALKTGPFEDYEKFAQQAKGCDYTSFTHYNFFYSYPAFDKSWPEKSCEFHRVHTRCHVCGTEPSRNYAGVGTLYLSNNYHSHLACRRMIILCREHVHGLQRWPYEPAEQLSLF